MSFGKALLYFLAEAWTSLVRSWRVSLITVLTMAVTLFLCGGFLVVAQNLSGTLDEWRRGLRVIVYLGDELDDTDLQELDRRLREPPWVRGLEVVDPEEAVRRFRRAFPGLAEITGSWERPPFPTSYEVAIDASRADGEAFDRWLERVRGSPAVEMVDADRDWLDQMSAMLRLAAVSGVVVGGLLLAVAVLTAASILSLTAHLRREETAIMRLVGATEFYVRGPFVVGGLLQGVIGAGVALATLAGAVQLARGRSPGPATTLLLGEFLDPAGMLTILALGAVAGLAGAALSLRRERQGLDPLG